MTRAELVADAHRPHVEHMAVLLAFADIDLDHVDAPIIYLTTRLADRDIRFVDIHLAVERAFALRRDLAAGAWPHATPSHPEIGGPADLEPPVAAEARIAPQGAASAAGGRA